MVVGHGDIGTALIAYDADREDRLFFAAGVSNSKEHRRSEYERDKKLLLSQDKNRHIVYFGSLSIFYTDTLYAQHKKRMEKLVRENFKHYCIVRLGNIDWGVNPHTIINYLRAHPEAEIQDVYRYVTDIEEFLYWINLIPDWNCEMNIPGQRMKVIDIVRKYVRPIAIEV